MADEPRRRFQEVGGMEGFGMDEDVMEAPPASQGRKKLFLLTE